MGCKHYFAVDRLEDLVVEGDSRSSSRVHEHENFQLVSQLQIDVHLLELCEQTGWLSTHNESPRSISICIYVFICVFLSPNVHQTIVYRFPEHSNGTFLLSQGVSPFYKLEQGLVGLVGCLQLVEQLLNPIPSSNHFSRKSTEAVEVIHTLFRISFLQFPACDLRAPPGSHRPVLEAHPGANTFPSACGLSTTSSTGPSASRNNFSVSTITDGNARAGGRSHLPALTLAWLYIEPSPCGGVRPAGDQSIATPEPSSRTIPTLDWTLVARHSLKCVTTLGSRRSCPGWAAAQSPKFRPFSPALPVTWAHFQDRWGLSSPYHVAATYPFRAARHFFLCVSLEIFATRARRYSSFSPPCGATIAGRCLHKRRFGTLASPPSPVTDPPWWPHHPGHPKCLFFVYGFSKFHLDSFRDTRGWWNVNWFHIQRDKWTWRNRPELIVL